MYIYNIYVIKNVIIYEYFSWLWVDSVHKQHLLYQQHWLSELPLQPVSVQGRGQCLPDQDGLRGRRSVLVANGERRRKITFYKRKVIHCVRARNLTATLLHYGTNGTLLVFFIYHQTVTTLSVSDAR